MRFALLLTALLLLTGNSYAATESKAGDDGALPCFSASPYFGEQELAFTYAPGIRININAPSPEDFDKSKPTRLILYALPNGNSIAQTIGKLPAAGDDWHYQIQHIGAQTRYVRNIDRSHNIVTVYLEADTRSWGKWLSASSDRKDRIKETVEFLYSLFSDYRPTIELNSHSGGGNFIFGFIDAAEEIPAYIKRISFIDSNYNWDAGKYGKKLTEWLGSAADNSLFVACYDDANALLDGKAFITREKGTWHKTYLMQRYLKNHAVSKWTRTETDSTICFVTEGDRIKMYFRKNPERKIYHTILVERNGFIESVMSGRGHESHEYVFMGERVYDGYIQDSIIMPHGPAFPPRGKEAMTGSRFTRLTEKLNASERDSIIFREIVAGNIPGWLRKPVYLTDTLADAAGKAHEIIWRVLPDFIAIGDDSDFMRVPMLPLTAQKIADHFGAVLPTRRMSDLIHRHSTFKATPHPMTPDSTMTTVPVFARHDSIVEACRMVVGAHSGQLTAGHKKDIVITNRIASEPGRLFIYGWHYPDGKAIQPLSAAHSVGYVDYSHGVRLVSDDIIIDGRLYSLKQILRDPVLYKLVSDEDGPMERVGYSE